MSFVLLGILNSQAAGAGFDPADLNPDLWLDAADASTITESGGSVSQWDNKGTLENFSQATSADQPTTGVSTQNGLNVIDFADDVLTGATKSQWTFMHDGTSYFIAAAFRPTTSQNSFLFNNTNGASANTGNFIAGFRDNGDSEVVIYRGVSLTASVVAISTLLTGNEYSIFSALIDPDNGTAADRGELFKNDGVGVKPNTRTNSPSSSDPTFNLNIGDSGLFGTTMSLGELIVVSGADATETNRQTVVDYLNDKWSIF